VQVPVGQIKRYMTPEEERRQDRPFRIAQNEFMVYNSKQVRMRYLVQVRKEKEK